MFIMVKNTNPTPNTIQASINSTLLKDFRIIQTIIFGMMRIKLNMDTANVPQ
jgi:hypothetical protein